MSESTYVSDAQALADALPDGVIVADADQRVVLVSAEAARMFGTTSERCVGGLLGDVLALQDTEGRDWSTCNTPYAGLRSRRAVPEQSWLLPDGTEVLVAARLLRTGKGSPVSSVALTLRSGRGRARLDRERSDLVATVAHELRSPLTGVKGFVQALIKRWEQLNDEQRLLMLATVSADADRLSRLITELLDVARIDTGRLQLHIRPSDVVDLARRVVDSVVAGTSRSVELVAETESLPIVVDPDKFTQVITNLVENGVRHGDGMVRVEIAARSDMVRVIVSDDGEGIDPELRRRVFTKFWRGGSSGGSGLGLYLVNGLVRAHGGSVAIEDVPSGGARVVTTWPLGGIE